MLTQHPQVIPIREDFVRQNGVRRTVRCILIIFQRYDQAVRIIRQKCPGMFHVRRPLFGRQGYQRGAIVKRIEWPGFEIEVVAAIKRNWLRQCAVAAKRSVIPDLEVQIMLAEESVDGNFRQFHTDDFEALSGEPKNIRRFATKRDEYPTSPGELRPVRFQLRIAVRLVPANPPQLPAFKP